jgi:hypothetical protein
MTCGLYMRYGLKMCGLDRITAEAARMPGGHRFIVLSSPKGIAPSMPERETPCESDGAHFLRERSSCRTYSADDLRAKLHFPSSERSAAGSRWGHPMDPRQAARPTRHVPISQNHPDQSSSRNLHKRPPQAGRPQNAPRAPLHHAVVGVCLQEGLRLDERTARRFGRGAAFVSTAIDDCCTMTNEPTSPATRAAPRIVVPSHYHPPLVPPAPRPYTHRSP